MVYCQCVILTATAIRRCFSASSSAALAWSFRTRVIFSLVRTCQLWMLTNFSSFSTFFRFKQNSLPFMWQNIHFDGFFPRFQTNSRSVYVDWLTIIRFVTNVIDNCVSCERTLAWFSPLFLTNHCNKPLLSAEYNRFDVICWTFLLFLLLEKFFKENCVVLLNMWMLSHITTGKTTRIIPQMKIKIIFFRKTNLLHTQQTA